MAKEKPQRAVLAEGNFLLSRVFSQKNKAVYFRLSNKGNGKTLLTTKAEPPMQNTNLYVIDRVRSFRHGGINNFPRMIEMIRTLVRKESPQTDIVSFAPKYGIGRYYYNRLGAQRKSTGYIHFPENLTQRKRR